jgi:lipopolysaccharide/colanic/teichoic acid biosynthesis glycosyltransferase
VLHAVTVSATTRLMLGQLGALREAGFEVSLVSGPGPELEAVAAEEGVPAFSLPMEREISPWRDLRSFWHAWRLLRRVRPTLLNVGTAKAGLLTGVAAVLAGVPCRIYTLHGLRLETTRGLKRFLLTWAERVACRCAHRVLCVSESVRQRTADLGLAPLSRTCVLGAGSFNGLNFARFSPSPARTAAAAALREELGIPADAPVVGFIGRLTRDKGIPELVEAYRLLRARVPEVRLLILGRYESGDPVPEAVQETIAADPGILHVGYVSDPSRYYHVMQVLALPTYREGFPTVGLEAAAAGKPVVTTYATGAVDAVVEGVTGLLVPVGDAPALARALAQVLEDRALARRLGQAGRARVERGFAQARVWSELVALYRRVLAERGLVTDAGGPRRTWRWRVSQAIKRSADVVGAGLGLVLCAPIMAAAAAAIRLTMGPPVLFRQRRTGEGGRLFTVIKLRTMHEARDGSGRLLPDAARLSPLGRWLRRLSVDELPQLWNVLKGDMSLVGPRPLMPEYLPAYTERERLRHLVKPGITGCAQVNGRHHAPFSVRLEMDSWYVEHWSLWLDLRLLLLTLPRALTLRGAEAYQEETIDDRGFWRHLEQLRPGRGELT